MNNQLLGYFREPPCVAGEYLLGNYKLNETCTPVHAFATAWCGQGVETVLELEVNGELTGKQLTLPAGLANREQTADLAITDLAVPKHQTMRWKIVSGPTTIEQAAWKISLGMRYE